MKGKQLLWELKRCTVLCIDISTSLSSQTLESIIIPVLITFFFFRMHFEMKINKSLLFFFLALCFVVVVVFLQKLHIFYWEFYAFVSVLIILPCLFQ